MNHASFFPAMSIGPLLQEAIPVWLAVTVGWSDLGITLFFRENPIYLPTLFGTSLNSCFLVSAKMNAMVAINSAAIALSMTKADRPASRHRNRRRPMNTRACAALGRADRTRSVR
jgi:hypothetical protein